MAYISKRAVKIRQMYESGMTYEEIGKALGISRQAAHQGTINRDGFRENTAQKVVYVGLRNWMLTNRVNMSELERRCGGVKLRSALYNSSSITKKNIDLILKVTGLTYEKCFKEDINR